MNDDGMNNSVKQQSATEIVFRGLAAGLTFGVGVFLLSHQWDFSSTVTFAIGLFSIFMGLMLAGSTVKSWIAIFGLVIFGFYQIAKALGVIEGDYFRYLVGIPLIVIGIYSFYKMLARAKV